MSAVRISVLVPCHNAAPYVGAALDSVLAQDHPDVEVIVVDDGSTDGSTQIVAGYAARGVKVLAQENRGAAAARNAAFAASTGDAVLYMDGDDLIPPGHLSALAARLDGPGAIAMGEWDRFYTDPAEATFPPRPTYRDAAGPEWLIDGTSMMQPGMFLLPRAIVERRGGWDERLSLIDDFEFFTRMIAPTSVRFAPGARLYYRSGIGGLSGAKSRRAVESAYLSLTLGTGHLLAAEDSARTRRAAADILQAFDYDHYPAHPDLRAKIRTRVAALGGAAAAPSGPPRFHALRRVVGWRLARRVQRAMGR